MTSDDYVGDRGYLGSVRLNAQHYLWEPMLGYLLHPKIPTTTPENTGLAIVDVGTGTGSLLLDLSQRLPVQTSLVGLDISAEQYSHTSWLPSNVTLLTCDVLDPAGPPAKLVGKFDIVHARFLALLVKESPNRLIDFYSQLLKPGGFLQWGEPNWDSSQVISNDGSNTQAVDAVVQSIKSELKEDWVDALPQSLQSKGFEIIEVDKRLPKPWQRGWWLDNFCMASEEIARTKGQANAINPAEVLKEKRAGTWATLSFQVIVARKKKAHQSRVILQPVSDGSNSRL